MPVDSAAAAVAVATVAVEQTALVISHFQLD
jgi:hypothetical protein